MVPAYSVGTPTTTRTLGDTPPPTKTSARRPSCSDHPLQLVGGHQSEVIRLVFLREDRATCRSLTTRARQRHWSVLPRHFRAQRWQLRCHWSRGHQGTRPRAPPRRRTSRLRADRDHHTRDSRAREGGHSRCLRLFDSLVTARRATGQPQRTEEQAPPHPAHTVETLGARHRHGTLLVNSGPIASPRRLGRRGEVLRSGWCGCGPVVCR